MFFVTSKNLRPGMVLASDINFRSDNNSNSFSLILSKGQILNDILIKKIIYHNIPGVYIENEVLNYAKLNSTINLRLEAKTLSEVKKIFFDFKSSTGKIESSFSRQILNIVDNLMMEILYKRELKYNIIELKNYDAYTYQHSLNVAVLSIVTGIELGFNEHMLHDLGIAGLFHDMGKMLIPLEIINKQGKLTEDEYEIIKTHPNNAVTKLEHLVSNDILRGIESHHEKLDGSGYPFGKKRDNIHIYGKILTISDVYDALTSDRSYRKKCSPGEVIEYMIGCTDTHFDYKILCKFLDCIVAYPLGTFVKLSNGKTAVVIKNYSKNIMRPLVRIVNDDSSVGEYIDLLYDKNYIILTITGMDMMTAK